MLLYVWVRHAYVPTKLVSLVCIMTAVSDSLAFEN